MGFPNANILDINLTEQTYKIKILDGELYKKYPGGSALGMYLLLKELEPQIDPLSDKNLLIFSVSPLTGLPISGQSRMVVTTKSPYTGTAGDSQAGGFMPAHIKFNGYDSIIFRGKSAKPVYVYIDQDKVEFRDAKNVWGKITGDAETIIKQELHEEKVEIAQIGPGGENLVKYACILNDRSRANGRNGVGAVMGSKHLKALVVKKQKPIKPFNFEKFKTITKNVKQQIADNEIVTDIGENGTDGLLEYQNENGYLPTNNWQSGYFGDKAQAITGTTMKETILKSRDTCYACAIRCKRVVEVEGKVDPMYGGPEYETCATFGSYCGVSDMTDIAYANQLCNMYGLDTISCGATIAFAMECYVKGLITKEDTDGIELKFGDASCFETLIRKIALKEEGIGELLSEGSYRASERIGKGSKDFSMTCKKQEMPAHMPQMKQNLALMYAVNPYGADHQSVEHDTSLMTPEEGYDRKNLSNFGHFETCYDLDVLDENKVRFSVEMQKFYSTLDSLSLCQFAWGPTWQLYGIETLLDTCKYGVDWITTVEELQAVGERRINMMRFFNAREGFTKEDDQLPKRLFEPLSSGPGEGGHVDKEDFEKAKIQYYELMGWNTKTGNPKPETLKRIGLEWLLTL